LIVFDAIRESGRSGAAQKVGVEETVKTTDFATVVAGSRSLLPTYLRRKFKPTRRNNSQCPF
jgi:hypothetical protein